MTESRPVPRFYNETLLTKKVKYSTPNYRKSLPPRPCKSISPKISLYQRFSTNGSSNTSFKVQAVSFKENTDNCSILNKHYDENCDELYFQQCFEVFSTLGSGFFGDVFKVRSKEDGKFYAVKKSRERFKGKSDREQKLQEVAKHEHLPEHPNLVKFYKAWEEKQRLYIQIELCECSLSMFADLNHDIQESVVWDFLIDMLQAVEHLHKNNLMHLDIKLENIFISKDGLYKLGDFGLVVDLSKENIKDPIVGDPKYLAKETMKSIVTQAADIFSLGITTLELACDLDLPSGGDIWHQLRNGKIPEYCFKDISVELKYIIKKMMHPDHLKRPTATELLNYPIIKKLKRKRIVKNKIRTIYHSVIEKFTLFFGFLFQILCIFQLIEFFKKLYSKKFGKVTTPIMKKDVPYNLQNSYYSFNSPITKENTHDECNTQTDFNNSMRNYFAERYSNFINQIQDSTINSSANPNVSSDFSSDSTPPNPSFNHYLKNQTELQSTTNRNKKKQNSNIFRLSNGFETPVKRGLFDYKNDESPTSAFLEHSINQSTCNRLSFSDISDDDNDYSTNNMSKLNNASFHNQTIGQRNLLKIFEKVDEK